MKSFEGTRARRKALAVGPRPPEPARRRQARVRGAVLVEFVLAIFPLMVMFFSFVQLSRLATARLVLKHGAIVGARAAAVISNANNNTPDANGDGKNDIKAAVNSALGPWQGRLISPAFSSVNVEVNDESSKDDPYNWVTVTVTAQYHCRVPLGYLACGGRLRIPLSEQYRMPHQGANYLPE